MLSDFNIRLRSLSLLLALFAMSLLQACDGSSDLEELTSLFSLNVEYDPTTQKLAEGGGTGIDIPITLNRVGGFSSTVTVSVSGAEVRDDENISTSLSNTELNPGADQTELNIRMGIGRLPLASGSNKTFIVTASAGGNIEQTSITVAITPIDAPDVYLLIGQSNMVGFGGDGDKQAGPGGLDEPNDRIQQLNVSKNDTAEIFTTSASFTQTARIARQPYIVRAEDPLHVPLDPDSLAKEEAYIGPGLSFAKAALSGTTRNIILVPAAWSASAFCASSPLSANWNANSNNNASLGNTLLFDRAIARTNLALTQSGGILRGILWHQGENDSDAQAPACADLYEQNLISMVQGLRSSIREDARGSSARGSEADIPFVVGTMSRGSDERGDLSDFIAEKIIVDTVHRSVASSLPFADFTNLDDLTPANGFPCGNDSCIHFGSMAYREMGRRYHATLLRAAGS